MISAHYGFSDVFDNLIISLCKFTTLSSEVRPEALLTRCIQIPAAALGHEWKDLIGICVPLVCREPAHRIWQ